MLRTDAAPASVRCYVRVSTEEQAVSGYSLAAQREQLQAYLDRMGWPPGAWYADEGKSAKDLNRPGFQQMIQDAQQGDLILVTKLDRLTRSVRDLDDLLRLFERRDLLFQSATEQFETRTPGGRLYMGLIAVIAQWEREIIADRSAAGKKQKVIQGEWAGGPIPFGYIGAPSGQYKRGKELLKLVPDPERAHIIQQIFERYNNGQGLRALCIWLNDELRVHTSNGARWRVSTLTRLLTNPIYNGYVTHGRRTGGEVTVVRGSHPPLVPKEQFMATQRLFAKRKTMAPRQATGRYPLAGVARCGICGGAIDSAVNRRKHSYSYRCRNYVNGIGCGDPGQKANSGLSGQRVEAALVKALQGLPQPADWRRLLQWNAGNTDEQSESAPAELKRLRSLQTQAEQAIRRWDRAFEADGINWSEWQAKTQPHRETLQHVRAQVLKAIKAPARPPQSALASVSTDIKRAWDHLAPPERKALLQHFTSAFGVEIRIHPQRGGDLVSLEQLG